MIYSKVFHDLQTINHKVRNIEMHSNATKKKLYSHTRRYSDLPNMENTLYTFGLILWSLMQVTLCDSNVGILYPKRSETRQILSLDGFWDFVMPPLNHPDLGIKEEWYKKDISKLTNLDPMLMPVPSSYNDITTNYTIRQNVGPVWYQRTFYIPKNWEHDKKIWLRFSSVMYSAKVWINDHKAMEHEIGHLPFQDEITHHLSFGKLNRITVECNNLLSSTSVPQGDSKEHVPIGNGEKITIQNYPFDFFNYAGIDRPVTLFTTPLDYIDDINILPYVKDDEATVSYEVVIKEDKSKTKIVVKVVDADNKEVAEHHDDKGNITIKHPKLWWPYLMNENPGYILQVELRDKHSNELIDIYRQPFGIRTIKWDHTSLTINDKKVYLTGFGRHEDSDIRGSGLDLSLIARDYSLMQWIGSNAFRTTYYPYADEILDMADRYGIMVIDECPSVKTKGYSDKLLKNHLQSLSELWKRDKNRPSIIMWSVANDPDMNSIYKEYFKKVIDHIKKLDNQRPVTLSSYHSSLAEYLDVIMVNEYKGWNPDGGYLENIVKDLVKVCEDNYKKYKKPLLISAYGGDALDGLHTLPALMFSEEYQTELLSETFKAFDEMREKNWFIGEFVTTFADFEAKQEYLIPGGNKKGLFTRNRQPKQSANLIRKRYWSLAQELNNATLPTDLFQYIIKK